MTEILSRNPVHPNLQGFLRRRVLPPSEVDRSVRALNVLFGFSMCKDRVEAFGAVAVPSAVSAACSAWVLSSEKSYGKLTVEDARKGSFNDILWYELVEFLILDG